MKVFLSSTFADLYDHRRVLLDTLRKMGDDIAVAAMEDFGSDPRNPIELCTKKVAECDAYVGVLGTRYGSIDKSSGMSITEIEYRTALARQLPVLLYLTSDEYLVKPSMVDTGAAARKLQRLRQEVSERHVVQRFSTPEDLTRLVVADLHRLLRNPTQGLTNEEDVWVPVEPSIIPGHPFLLCHLTKPSARSVHDERSSTPYYDVQLFLDLYEDDPSKYDRLIQSVDKVIYRLHDTFIIPVVAMQNWRENFLLEISVWGEFWVRGTVFFRDNTKGPLQLYRYVNAFPLDRVLRREL